MFCHNTPTFGELRQFLTNTANYWPNRRLFFRSVQFYAIHTPATDLSNISFLTKKKFFYHFGPDRFCSIGKPLSKALFAFVPEPSVSPKYPTDRKREQHSAVEPFKKRMQGRPHCSDSSAYASEIFCNFSGLTRYRKGFPATQQSSAASL